MKRQCACVGSGLDTVLSKFRNDSSDKLGAPFSAKFLYQFSKHHNKNKSLKIVVEIFSVFRLSRQRLHF